MISQRTSIQFIFIGLMTAIVGVGCARAKTKPNASPQSNRQEQLEPSHPPQGTPSPAPSLSDENFGPPAPQVQESYGPVVKRRRAVVVVLGPGLARGFAEAGVLMALEEAKIPVAGVIGTEMGALIGALYGTSSSSNDFEWRLLQMKKDDFIKPRSGLSSLFSSGAPTAALDQYVEKSFGAKEFRDSRVSLRMVIKKPTNGNAVQILEQGALGRAARASMGVPGLYKYADLAGEPAGSAANEAVSILDECAVFGSAPILMVDVVDRSGVAPDLKISEELKQYLSTLQRSPFHRFDGATWTLHPAMPGMGYLDSDRSADAIYSGKKAVNAIISKIREELAKE